MTLLVLKKIYTTIGSKFNVTGNVLQRRHTWKKSFDPNFVGPFSQAVCFSIVHSKLPKQRCSTVNKKKIYLTAYVIKKKCS